MFYVHFEESPSFTFKKEHKASAEAGQTFESLRDEFVQAYNTKFGSKRTLLPSSLILQNDKGTAFKMSSRVADEIPVRGDAFAKTDVNQSKRCTNNGCEKNYTEAENNDHACTLHPGAPVFHEGYKGWSCCTKRVIAFDDFLNMPGCTTGRHSDERRAPPEKPKPESSGNGITMVSTGNVEVYSSGNKKPARAAVQPITDIQLELLAQQAAAKSQQQEDQVKDDPPDATIEAGTQCKRGGCTHSYVDQSSKTSSCVYHSGVPIFHEGSKGWSCCRRKCLDFDDFMKIEGCEVGKHKFLLSASAQEQVKCRYDWYQIPSKSQVLASVYAKNVVADQSSIKFEPYQLKIDLKFKDGKKYTDNIVLSHVIEPDKCKFKILSTKVEIELAKGDGSTWTELEAKIPS